MSLLLLAILLSSAPGATVTASRFSHDDWTNVLFRFVDEHGLVDYQALAQDRVILDRYLSAVRSVSPKSQPELFPAPADQLAYYLNAYNALVFDGVLMRGPEEESVWKGGLISGYRFFVAMKVIVGGEKTNLKKLEDKMIRRQFQDPRVHAALNCASISCPRLPRKAFDPEHVDDELDAAMREFVGNEKNVRVDHASQVVYLSRIFSWFAEDFLTDEKGRGNERPSLIDYVNRYRSPEARISEKFKVRFLEYDKGINSG